MLVKEIQHLVVTFNSSANLQYLLVPVYGATLRTSTYLWGPEQQQTLDKLKKSIVSALPLVLWEQDLQLEVSATPKFISTIHWPTCPWVFGISNLQTQSKSIGQWRGNFQRYTEPSLKLKALLEQSQLCYGVEIPIMPWVIAEASPIKTEVCIQMVMYLLDWAKPGLTRVLQLHEKIATFPATKLTCHNLPALFFF